MTDVVVTCPQHLWDEWLAEGDLAGHYSDNQTDYHFYLRGPVPRIAPGERVYVVAHGRLRGYAPLVRLEQPCALRGWGFCLLRRGDAVAVTIDEPIRGFRGWRYRFWDRDLEQPFRGWTVAKPADRHQPSLLGLGTP